MQPRANVFRTHTHAHTSILRTNAMIEALLNVLLYKVQGFVKG